MVAAVAGVSAEGNPQIPSELHRCPPVKWQPTQHKSTYLTDRVRGVAVPLVSSGSAGAHIGTGRRTHSHTDTHPLDDEVENDKLALKDEHNLTLLVAIEHRSLEAFGICNGSSKSKRGRSA